jgi:hypothetical protein
MNVGLQISLWDPAFSSFGSILRSEIPDNSSLNFLRNCHAVFYGDNIIFPFPPILYKYFNFSTSSTTPVFCCFFKWPYWWVWDDVSLWVWFAFPYWLVIGFITFSSLWQNTWHNLREILFHSFSPSWLGVCGGEEQLTSWWPGSRDKMPVLTCFLLLSLLFQPHGGFCPLC